MVSPCGGRVVFAGPFRSYGLLLIVDCGDGYHFVLAGLDRLDVAAGGSGCWRASRWVAGAADQVRRGRVAGCIVELRREGQPVDPGCGWTGGG